MSMSEDWSSGVYECMSAKREEVRLMTVALNASMLCDTLWIDYSSTPESSHHTLLPKQRFHHHSPLIRVITILTPLFLRLEGLIEMAPRRGAVVVPEEPQLGGLTFNEPLSWRAGKPIPTGELLRRLDKLSDELREMDQEEVDKDSLTGVAKDLAGQNLLSHKDKGVRAFTACCLVDVLKICAPDAPFTPTQLKVWRVSLKINESERYLIVYRTSSPSS
jgi:hypothetical protein